MLRAIKVIMAMKERINLQLPELSLSRESWSWFLIFCKRFMQGFTKVEGRQSLIFLVIDHLTFTYFYWIYNIYLFIFCLSFVPFECDKLQPQPTTI